MRRLIALLAGVTVAFSVAAGPVAAETGAPGNTPSSSVPDDAIPKDAVGLSPAQVAGSGLAVTLDAGASQEHDLVVSNHTANLRLTVHLAATDATGNAGAAAASWLAFGDDTIQLDPHVATTVPMTVAVPHDTQPGSALAHVTATVESAVMAADGTPVSGTATDTFPVSIVVSGTPTAQIAIADVHRDDQGARHQLALVLRNFGAQGAHVVGHVRVAGDSPQTLPFAADLAASRDTTIELDWNAPPAGTATDISVDLEYPGGNTASWSSRLGGSGTDLSPARSTASPTTIGTPASTSPAPDASAVRPWWKRSTVTLLAILALVAAGAWFGFEILATRRRKVGALQPPRSAAPAGWSPHGRGSPAWASGASDESLDLARQLVRLTDVVVQLVESHRAEQDVAAERARARSPGAEPPVAARLVGPAGPSDPDESRNARAGPEPPGPTAPVEPEPVPETSFEPARSASPTPGASSRPDLDAHVPVPVEAILVDDDDSASRALPEPARVTTEPGPTAFDPRAAVMERLMELDRERRRLRSWMDSEDSGHGVDPPVDSVGA
jgi:hypothetical protein